MFRFGGGGIAGWGTICGTLNGAAAFISMAVGQNLNADGVTKEWTHRNNLINGVFQYYAETPLPTNNAFKSTQGVLGLPAWTPPAVTGYTMIENAPTSTANSPLCHSSLVQWTTTTGAADGGPLQRDRCGKACFDVARKTIELLNKYFELASAPGVALDPERRRLRRVPQDVHRREDGLRVLPRQHHRRRPHELSDPPGPMIRNGARTAPLR